MRSSPLVGEDAAEPLVQADGPGEEAGGAGRGAGGGEGAGRAGEGLAREKAGRAGERGEGREQEMLQEAEVPGDLIREKNMRIR